MRLTWLRREDVILVLALALRLGWVWYGWILSGPELHYDDEKLHWQLATHLAREGDLVTDDGRRAARMPLYPALLAPCALLGEYGVLAARLVQAGLGTLTAVLAFRLALSAVGCPGAWLAGMLVAVDPFAIFFTNLLLTETLFTLLLMATVAYAWRAATRPDEPGGFIGLAVLGAASLLTRPSVVLLLPLLWLTVGLLSRYRRLAFARLALCPIVLAAALLPWGVRNRVVLGTGAWLSTNGGVTLYDAQGPQADGSSNQRFLVDNPAFAGLDEVALDRTLSRRAWECMRADPARVLRLALVKLRRIWSLTPHVAEYRTGAAAWAGALYTLVVLAGAVGAVLRVVLASRLTLATGRSRPARGTHAGSTASAAEAGPVGSGAWLVLLWLPVLYFTLLHCVFIGSVRYRVPLLPLLALAAAAIFVRSRDSALTGDRGSVLAH
jgi:hypothetical protein